MSKRLLSHSISSNNDNDSNDTSDNNNHAFSQLVPKIGKNVRSKVRLQQQTALAKITVEKEKHGDNMNWLNNTDNVLDKDDPLSLYGIKDKEYNDIKSTFITSSKEKHHLLFSDEKGYIFSAKSKASIKLKPLRKLDYNDNSNDTINDNSNDTINENSISSSQVIESKDITTEQYYNKSYDLYDDDNHNNDNNTTNNNNNNTTNSINNSRYNTYFDEVKELSPKVEDKYFGVQSKLHYYATYTELDRKKNIIHGGCSSLSSLINQDDNLISQSISLLINNGVISAPPSSRVLPLLTERSEMMHRHSSNNSIHSLNNNDNTNTIIEPIIEIIPDRFLFDFFIVSCSHLIKADIIGTSDPIVKVFFNDIYIAETSCIKNSLNPVWDDLEKFEINIPINMKVRDCKLDLEVYDTDKFDDPDFLGSVTFEGRELIKFIKSETGNKLKVRNTRLINQRSHKLGISPKHPSRDLIILDHIRYTNTTIATEISSYDEDILNNEDDDTTIVQSIVDQDDMLTENNDNNSLGIPSLNFNDNDDMSDFNYRINADTSNDPKEVDNFIDDTFSTFAPNSPRAQFLVGCLSANVPPLTVGLLRRRISNTINLAHMTLGDKLATLFAECISGIPTVESLILCDNHLSQASLSVIMDRIKSLSQLKILDISSNNLGPKSAALLQQYISNSDCPLKCLILKDTSIDDIELSRFVMSFKDNIRLEEIDLSKNLLGRDENKHITPDFIGAGDSISDLLLNSKMPLKHLNLEWNSLRSENSLAVCDSIATNTTLKYLNLSMNSIGREGALSLAKALIVTKTLEELILATCNIDSIGAFAIIINAQECPTLKQLTLDDNPIGEECGRAILHVCAQKDRLLISCATCDMTALCSDILFHRKNFINKFTLNLGDVYERAIAVHILDLVAKDPSLGLYDVLYQDLEGNDDEITLTRAISKDNDRKDEDYLNELIALKSDLTKVRKVFRKMDESGLLDQSQFVDFLSKLNIQTTKLDATFANFIKDVHDNTKRIDENEAINFIVYISTQALASQENVNQESYSLCKRESNKSYSRFIPPTKGTLKLEVRAEHFSSRAYGVLSKKGLQNMTKVALKSKDPLQTLLYIVDSYHFYYDEANLYAAILKKQTGDITLTLSYILPKMVSSNDARRLVNFYINSDKRKLESLEKLLGATYKIILGMRNGFYSLNLSTQTDRRAVEFLFSHSNRVSEKRKSLNKWDISQFMQWNGFRNMFLNGEHVIPNGAFFHPLPTKGIIEFDFVDVERPDPNILPLNDYTLLNIAVESNIIRPSQIEWASQKLIHMADSAAYIFDESDMLHFKKVKKEYKVGVPIGSICITLISCSHLDNKDKEHKGGKSDPFVLIKILDNIVESKHISNDLNPVFNDRFEIEWDGISSLECNVWDEDFNKENDPIGSLIISLAALDFSNGKKVKIDRYLDNDDRGKIKMELTFKPKVDAVGTIIIHLISCNNLIASDIIQEEKGTGTSDPYVVMSTGLNKCESKHIFNCLDPVFDETFELEWDGISPLYCQLWDDDVNSFDDPLGDILVDLEKFLKRPESTIRIWKKALENIKHGTITMDISFKPRWNPIGKLSMKYISCRDLENKDGMNGISDPYIVFKCGPNRIHTNVLMNTLNPVFDGVYDMDWDGKVPMIVEIWDSDCNNTDDILGEIIIHVEHYNFHNGKRVLKVVDRKLTKVGWGRVTMDIQFYPSIVSLNETMDLNDHEFIPNTTRAFSIRKNMERLSEYLEFQKRKEKLRIIEKKENNIIFSTTEASIDEDNEDYIATATEIDIPATPTKLSLVNPDLIPSKIVKSLANSPQTPTSVGSSKQGTPVTPSNKSPTISQQGSPTISRNAMSPSIIENKLNEVEITAESKCASILTQLEQSLEPRLIFSRQLALILEVFAIGQTARSNYGSYRVELIIHLFHRIVDLENFGFVLFLLNPREYAQVLIRMGYLTLFNPFHPQGFYYIDHSQWDHRQLMKILMLINHYEPNASSFTDMVFKQINNNDESVHDAIANNPHNDRDLDHPEILLNPKEQSTQVTDLLAWTEEHSFPRDGILVLNFLCADTSSEQIDMNTKRFSILPLLLMDHDEVTHVIDTTLPIIPEDSDFYREELSNHVRLSRKSGSHRNVQSDIDVVTNDKVEEVIDNDNSDDKDIADAIIEVDTIDDVELPVEETNNEVLNEEEVSDNKEDIVEASPQETKEEENLNACNEEEENLNAGNEEEENLNTYKEEEVPAVHTYPKTTIDQLSNYIHDKTEFKWSFTFIDSNEEDIEIDDGFEL